MYQYETIWSDRPWFRFDCIVFSFYHWFSRKTVIEFNIVSSFDLRIIVLRTVFLFI